LYWSAVHAESQRVIWAPSNGSPFYWHDPATGETKQVEIDDLSIEADLAWSPDRSEVLFSARRRGSGTHDLAVLRLSDERVKILASSRWILHGAWSPDAAQIAFTQANCLKVVAARGGPAREIVCAGGADLPAPGKFRGERVDYLWDNAIHPSWSPDGRRLAWTVPVPEKKRVELWIVDAASGAREVAFAGENDYYSLPRRPLWSPSGRHIAFTMLWYLDREIWRLRGLARAAPRWQAAQIGRASP
jgi:Tol biopolymer transport system component